MELRLKNYEESTDIEVGDFILANGELFMIVCEDKNADNCSLIFLGGRKCGKQVGEMIKVGADPLNVYECIANSYCNVRLIHNERMRLIEF